MPSSPGEPWTKPAVGYDSSLLSESSEASASFQSLDPKKMSAALESVHESDDSESDELVHCAPEEVTRNEPSFEIPPNDDGTRKCVLPPPVVPSGLDLTPMVLVVCMYGALGPERELPDGPPTYLLGVGGEPTTFCVSLIFFGHMQGNIV